MSRIKVSSFGIEHISCFKPNRLWFSTGNIIKEIDEEGHLLRELSVNLTYAGSHTLTNAGDLLFIKDSDIYMLSSSGEIRNLHIHANTLSYIHSSRLNGDIFVSEEGLIKRYNDKGVKLQTITALHDMIMGRFLFGLRSLYRAPITENINGDIIVTNVLCKVVAFTSNGRHKFNYKDPYNRSKLDPTGICNDRFGHILVGDSCFLNPCVHLLDFNGHLLAKLLIRQHNQHLTFNALCVDDKNNLYLGCRNEIKVYSYLSDTTITEHDATVIDE